MVGLSRFELLTPRLSSVCSNQLSYRPGPFFRPGDFVPANFRPVDFVPADPLTRSLVRPSGPVRGLADRSLALDDRPADFISKNQDHPGSLKTRQNVFAKPDSSTRSISISTFRSHLRSSVSGSLERR